MSGTIHPSEPDPTRRETIAIFIESHRKFRQQAAVVHIEGILDPNVTKVVFVSCMSRVRPLGIDLSLDTESFTAPRPQFVEEAQKHEINMLEIKLSKFRSQLRSLDIELEIVCTPGPSSQGILIEEAHRLRPMWVALHTSFPILAQLEERLPEDCNVAILGESVEPILILRETMLGGRSSRHSEDSREPQEPRPNEEAKLKQIHSKSLPTSGRRLSYFKRVLSWRQSL